MSGCLETKLCDDQTSTLVLQELCKLCDSLILKSKEDINGLSPSIKSSFRHKKNGSKMKPILDCLVVAVKMYGDLMNRHEELNVRFVKTTKSFLEAAISTKSGMGRRTESGQLAFESQKTPSPTGIHHSNPDDDDEEEGETGRKDEGSIDAAVASFLSVLRVEYPALHARAVPPSLQ
jgi:hypothetical protein